MNTKFEYLGVNYDIMTNWAEIELRPPTLDLPTMRENGLNWIGESGWELVSAVPCGVNNLNHPVLYLIFKKGTA